MVNKSEIFKKLLTCTVSLPVINENGCYEMGLERVHTSLSFDVEAKNKKFPCWTALK